MTMIISAIAAMGSNRVIGTQGDLPWNLPEDMKFFREKTANHIVIMGRKTFESFPGGRPLPGRFHIVITRQTGFATGLKNKLTDLSTKQAFKPGTEVIVVSSVDQAVHEALRNIARYGNEAFIIGGGEIYKQMLPHTNRVYLTEIHRDFRGDAHFPELSSKEFRETRRESRPGEVPFDFVIYERL